MQIDDDMDQDEKAKVSPDMPKTTSTNKVDRSPVDMGSFERLFQLSGDGIIYTDTHGVLLKVNPAFCSLVGYEADELHGRNIMEFSPTAEVEGEEAVIESILEVSGTGTCFEKRLLHSDGRRLPVQVECLVDRDDAGQVKGLWGIVHDLTEQRNAEATAERVNAQYRFVTDNTDDIIWAVDQSLKYTFISHSVERLRGYTPEEVMTMGIKDSMTEESYVKVLKAVEAAQENYRKGVKDISVSLELELLCKDGSTIWVESVARAMLDADGKWVGIVGSSRDISAKWAMEQQLRQSKALLQSLIDATNDYVCLFSLDGEILVVNQAFNDLDIPIKAVVGDNLFHHVPAGYVRFQAAFDQVAATKEPVHEQMVWAGRIFEISLYPVPGENDEVSILASYARDVTEKHLAEDEHRRTQEKYKLFVETASEGIVGLDSNRLITYANQVFCDFLGYELNEVMGQSIKLFMPVEEFPDHEQRVERREKGLKERYERVFLRKDGSRVYGMVSGAPLFAEDGSYVGSFGMIADITEVREAHNRLLTILDGLAAGIYVSDLETDEVLFINKHMRQLFGEAEKGATCAEMFHDKTNRCSYCPKWRLLDFEGKPMDTVVEERYNKRLKRWFLHHDRAIEWLEGKMVHMHLATEITELKAMAQELEEAMFEAQAANTAKNEFLANMSHEIRTPLNGLLGMLQLLQMTSLVDVQVEYLDTALESGRNLLQILNDILDLSKVESGKIELEELEFDLGDIADSVVSIFQPVAARNGVEISRLIDAELPRAFRADKGRLRQILFNLVGNASKFTDKGTITVEAYPLVSTLDDKDVTLFFRVSDTGIGIPEEKIEDVFNPFTQADGSITRKYQGTGLGLGIVRRLVDLMGGAISVSSKEGEGTSIIFTVKARRIRRHELKDRGSEGVASMSGLSILVAEDERVNRVVVERLLQKLGHQPRCVESGEAAFKELQRETFDLFFTDIQMPGMDGLETTRTIRRVGIDVPIIALTAHAMKGDRERYLSVGMNGYVAKPFTKEELQKEIDRVMADA